MWSIELLKPLGHGFTEYNLMTNNVFSIKNKASEKVSLAAMMIYPRIAGVGQNVQNVIFLNRRLKKMKAKAKEKGSNNLRQH